VSGDGADQPSVVLLQARQALERGDYHRVIQLLEPQTGSDTALADLAPPDPEALLLLATAQMGLGRSAEALLSCRRLRACGDASLRAQARELQRVLEAPSLKRPREWSLTLPPLDGSETAMGRQLGSLSRRRRQSELGPPPPAVGPTKAPLGFALLVLLLMLLALALGGCGAVHTELDFVGAGRLQVSHRFAGDGQTLPAWQQQLSQQLRRQGWQLQRRGDLTLLRAPVLPSRQALAALESSISRAGQLAGLSLPPPALQLRSRNWLVGVDERLDLEFDLRPFPSWATPELGLALKGLPPRAVRLATPLAIQVPASDGAAALDWPLQSGSTNHLVLHLWRWSPLGLGAIAVVGLLLLSLVLQRLRRHLGFGLPELPG